jgi:phosphatidylglycerol:prolipoprotein diacylglycerol transferase
MYPILFKLGPITIYSYGLMIALGIMVGLFLARRQAKREGIDPDKILDITLYVLLAALIGARLLFVFMNFAEYADEPLRILKIWEGGLVFYGGLLPAVAIGIWYIKRLGLPLWQIADILAPSLAIGHAMGRIGCFFAGCCYGGACDLPWAVTFTNPQSLAYPLGEPLHPTQLYSSLSLFALFGFLILLRKKKTFPGELFWTYILCYAFGRFLLEFLRGDPRGGFLGGLLSPAQVIGIPLAGISVAMLLYLRKRGSKRDVRR